MDNYVRDAAPQPFGFEYEHAGRLYTFVIVANSEQEARLRASAMKDAQFVGVLKPVTSTACVGADN